MYNNLSKNKMKFISGDCGSGKTHSLVQQILRTPDNYIVVQGTLHLTQQTAKDLGEVAKLITSVTSKNVHEDMIEFLLNPTHRVLIITDIAFLKIRDITLLQKWKIYLDDVVSFHHFATPNTNQKSLIENELFHSFEAVGDNHVTAKPVTDFDDVVLENAAKAFAFVQQYDHFLFNARFFEKVGGTNQYKQEKDQLQVMSWVNLKRFMGLDITFMANDFENTLVYLSSPESFECTTLSLRQRTVPLNQRMRVHYFSDVPLTASLRSNSPEQFEKVLAWVRENLTDYIFTVNSDQSEKVLNGKYVPPKSRGINDYKNYTKAVWLSSLKPSNVEVKQCELMFGLTYEQIVQAREKEELYQFVQRTKLRDYKSDEVVDIYVFDKEQALSLSDTPIFIDLGIEVTNSAKSVSTFVPLNLSTSQKKAYQRISLEHFPTIELFNKWMNKKAQLVLNEQQRAHFVSKYNSLL
ncbi:hypothetical protein [Enterobacter mori]|uniref:hypothetical protein n=1 Tax=Enterobacter mori TaxID=539813 RepID=UPI00206282CD|nr:MAG TPA: Serine protease/NTPase/helicase NS3 [Caudoviricetes sp.]